MQCIPNFAHQPYAMYRYEPLVWPSILFAVLFGISLALHLFQMIRTRTWYLIPLVIGVASESIGHAARAASASETPGCWSLPPYIIQSMLILMAPAFMAASIYMILGRIVLLTEGESYALIRRRWLTKIFVTADVIAICVQGNGAGILAQTEKNPHLQPYGDGIVIAGLFIQIIVFGFFVVVAALFHRSMSANPTPAAQRSEVRWKAYLLALYITSAMIWIRSMFRVVEYIEGNDGHLMRSEVYVFVFDSALMAVAVFWLNWFHPSEIGLLLKGERPITNGLELLISSRVGAKAGKENCSSSSTPVRESAATNDVRP